MNRNPKKKLGFKYIKFAVSILLFTAIFGVRANASTLGYSMKDYIRVALTSNYSNQNTIAIANSSIKIGYNENEFCNLLELDCKNGFYFALNDSNRFVSSKTYDDFDEMYELIEGSDDYMPLFIGEGQYKIITKPNREATDLADDNYSNLKSIVVINRDNKEQAIFEGKNNPLIKDSDDEPLKISNPNGTTKSYRGYVRLLNGASKGITVINHVDFDQYLYGVITSEMPKSWNSEALKAQALTARTYAFKRMIINEDGTYDVVDTTSDQVYGGVNTECKESIKAADETSRQVIIYTGDDKSYHNKLIDAFFSSCHGGVSSNSEDVWTAALPYCRSIVDEYEKPNKYTNWEMTFTLNDLQQAVNTVGAKIGTVTGCTVTTAKDSKRVVSFNIVGTQGTYRVQKDPIRTFCNKYFKGICYSNNFELFSGSNPKVEEVKTDNTIFIVGDVNTTPKEKNIKDLFMFNSSNNGKTQISNKVSVLSKDGTKEIDLETISYVETDSEKLAKGTYKIIGSGYGHGVGMSQYGANDMANAGFDCDEIIKYYYTDVDIFTID
ncbi:MAG: SpoIID/LytB domain-containing protein [Clostridia bacterium]|nr:SpoIID/LytB domain-containing protein [Clostridia bacterium]